MRQRWCECTNAGLVNEVTGGAHRKFLGVRCWPKIATHYYVTGVRLGHIADLE
jgi:hypothetical protein